MTVEALECLKRVRALKLAGEAVFPIDRKTVEKAIRKLKKFAKGLGLELTFLHALRHNFTSAGLEAGLSAKDRVPKTRSGNIARISFSPTPDSTTACETRIHGADASIGEMVTGLGRLF